jgi:H+/Cl- antiporter ClcA
LLSGRACCGDGRLFFSKAVSLATNLRVENGWLLYLLPAGGLLTILIYRLLKVTKIGTNQALLSAVTENRVPYWHIPAIFSATCINHLLGGSAGREGAALQMGGGMASLLAKVFKSDENSRRIITVSSMAAFFSALFGTPLGAAVFVLEILFKGKFLAACFAPVVLSSYAAFFASRLLGTTAEQFSLNQPHFSFGLFWKAALIAIAGAFVAVLFCKTLHFTEKSFKKLFKNDYLKIFIGGGVIIFLTILSGTRDYNGSGTAVIERVFAEGEVRYEAFLLKILFTAVTVAAGFKGGEIVPTLFIGSTFGAAAARILGVPIDFGGAVGLAALFCGATNCPIATIVLCCELFGVKGVLYLSLSSLIAFFLSGNAGLYDIEKPHMKNLKRLLILSKKDQP